VGENQAAPGDGRLIFDDQLGATRGLKGAPPLSASLDWSEAAARLGEALPA
jgi:hypothetical protein